MGRSSSIAIVQRRWPALWQVLAEAAPPTSIEAVTTTPNRTLFCNGIHLTSAVDRETEARTQAKQLPTSFTRVRVYGLALGDLPRELLRRPTLEHVEVVIMCPGLAKYVLSEGPRLQVDDALTWLDDPRVELILASEQTPLQRPSVVTPACLRLASDDAQVVRDALLVELAKPFQDRRQVALDTEISEQIAASAKFRAGDADVRELFDSRPGGTAFVVAGGPSLTASLPWLMRHRDEGVVISATTAVRVLQGSAIAPDVVVAVDHRRYLREHFDAVALDMLTEIPLVYLPAVHTSVLEVWPGPRHCAYMHHPRYYAMTRDEARGFLFVSGSVLHAQLDLAVKMGAARVIMFGADLCYPGGQSHVPDSAHYHRKDGLAGKLTVKNGHGESVPSDTNLISYLRDVEAYVTSHPDVHFAKLGRAGAAMRGVDWLDEGER